jgi:multiple sugar transport system permease protein
MIQPRSLIRLNRIFHIYLPLIAYTLFALFPIYYMFITSIKKDSELYQLKANPLLVTLQGLTLEHYRLLFRETLFPHWIVNSIVVCTTSTGISIVISILAAYALTRLRFRGARLFGYLVFVTYLVPYSLLFLPLSAVVAWLRLSDTLWSLIVTYPTILVPFATWLLMGYFRTIPEEIEQSAMIDGCNRLQSLIRVVLPVALPGVVCATLFAFSLTWNDLLYSMVFISPAEMKTLPVGISTELIRGDVYYWGALMGGAILGSLPVVLFYVFFMDYYVAGMTAGAVK